MKVPPRTLAKGQRCEVWVHDVARAENRMIFATTDLLLEAPNWALDGDTLILNGNGTLWRLPVDAPKLHAIDIQGVPPLNNDHVLDPDGVHIFVSSYDDWQLYRAPLAGGKAVQVSGKEGPAGLLHFLHGVSPDGQQLAFVGVQAEINDVNFRFITAEICTLSADGRGFRQITSGGAPSDGPEYSPDGQWLYFNTETFSGHAQIARMRPDGSDMVRLTDEPTVDWFPHISPDGTLAVYLAYPAGTQGHPADLWVDLKLVRGGDWAGAKPVARLFGGQGTINVNSWSPDSTRFAFVTYPMN
jgi:Tol biopolymer transport system component